MNSFINKLGGGIKKYGKYLLGLGVSAAILSQVIIPAASMRADQPRFNFLQGDYELLRGANLTQGESVWKDPVSAQVGDVVEGIIYYHNGMEGTIAENTTIKVNLPAETTNNKAVISASVSADNADTVVDTIVDGSIVGLSGLTINYDDSADLELVPGSVKWYPNQFSNPNTPVTLPGGQSGDEIIAPSGINIGDVEGCWQYAGYVTFQIKSNAQAIPGNLGIEKEVRNVSDSETNFVELTDADQNEVVEFKMTASNNGGSAINNVKIKDALPSELKEVSGSAKMVVGGVTTSLSDAELLGNGAPIGTIQPGDANQVVVYFRATTPSAILALQTVTNVATAFNASKTDSDDAKVRLNPGSANIERSKSAVNITRGGVDATTVTARSNDVIEYTLVTSNTGNLATDVTIADGVADILEYADVTEISDNGTIVNGDPGTNEEKTITWPEVNINPDESVVRTFKVKVKNPLPTNFPNGYHFDDRMYNFYGNEILIVIERPVLRPAISISKLVRNVTRNQVDYVEANTAYAGETLEYKILFTNSGNGPADIVKIYDILPANVSLDPNSPAIIYIFGEERSITEKITDGYIIATIPAGESGYVRFRVIIDSGVAAGERLVNNGYITDDGSTIPDPAETIIEAKVVPVNYPAPLPKTGPASLAAIVFASIVAAVNVIYLKSKKSLAQAARNIAIN
jgi:uncharacterized repeat protein (TIGR01451 family)